MGLGNDFDPQKVKLVERVTVRKFDGDWTEEQIASGEADHALAEVLTLEDGVIIDTWRKTDA